MRCLLVIISLLCFIISSDGFVIPSKTRTRIRVTSIIPQQQPRTKSLENLKKINLYTRTHLNNKVPESDDVIVDVAGVQMPKETAKSLALLLLAQFILFIGVGAVIPTIPLYGKEIGLSSATNGLVISAPALALLLLAKVSGEYADKARKPAMMWGKYGTDCIE